MNPTRYDDDFANALSDTFAEDPNSNAMQKKLDEMMRAKIEGNRRKMLEAESAYRDLCDALGVETLNGTIDGGASHLRIPVASIATIVSRIKALEAGVLAEGVL